MNRNARTRVDAPRVPGAFRPAAHPPRRVSWNVRSNVTAHSPALRRRPCTGTSVLGSALLLVAVSVQSEAQSRLGRLFSGPEQRIQLDRLRSDVDVTAPGEPVAGPDEADSDSRPGPGPPVFAATFNGLVVRGDGHRMAWIDGVETVPGAMTPTGVRIDAVRTPGGRLRVRLSGRSDERRSGAGSVRRRGGQDTRRVRARFDRDRYGHRRQTPGEFG